MFSIASSIKKNAQIKHVNWALADQAMVSGTNFLIGILLVRHLGVEQYGTFVLLWMIVQFCNSIQNAVIVSPMLSIGPKISAGEQTYYYSAATILQFSSMLLVPLGLFLAIATPKAWLPDWLNPDYFIPLAVCAFIVQLQDYARRYLFANEKYSAAFALDFIAYPGQLVTVTVLLRQMPSVEIALWGIVIAMTISVLLAVKLVRFRPVTMSYAKNTLQRHWKMSRWLLGSVILQWFSGNYFLIASGAILGPIAVGSIRAAQNLLGVTHIFFQGLENIVPVRASQYYKKDGLPAMKKYLGQVAISIGGGTVAIALVFAIFAEQLFSVLYGGASAETVIASYWYIPIYLFIALGLPLKTALRTLEKTSSVFWGYVLSAIFSFLLAKQLISEFSIHGAMFGLLSGQIIMILALLFSYNRNVTNE